MSPRTRSLVMTALFVACVVAVGYAFVFIPNVELVTATVFLSGILLGPKRGFLVGLAGEFLYSLLNPIGMAAPPLLLAQVGAMATVGFVGGLAGSGLDASPTIRLPSLRFGLYGLSLTFLFDALTTLSFFAVAGFSLSKLWASVVFGAPFYALHLVSNTLVFAALVPASVRVLRRVAFSADNRRQETTFPSA